MSSISRKQKILVVLGPTASGKSDLAVFLARACNGEVISADSRQVFTGLDIGSGKVTAREMKRVPHHLLDVASPKRVFSVARYKRLAEKAIRDITKRGKTPILCGGTAQYINAVLFDHQFPAVKPNAKLRKKLERMSIAELFSLLETKDPARAATIDRHNPRRLIRALEIVLTTNKPVPVLAKDSPYDVLQIGIKLPQEILKERIHARLLKRMRMGMMKEVERLRADGVSWQRLDDLGLEYRYVSRYLRGLMTKQDMLVQLEAEIWKYTKRQMTWWKHDATIHWVSDLREALRRASEFMR